MLNRVTKSLKIRKSWKSLTNDHHLLSIEHLMSTLTFRVGFTLYEKVYAKFIRLSPRNVVV